MQCSANKAMLTLQTNAVSMMSSLLPCCIAQTARTVLYGSYQSYTPSDTAYAGTCKELDPKAEYLAASTSKIAYTKKKNGNTNGNNNAGGGGGGGSQSPLMVMMTTVGAFQSASPVKKTLQVRRYQLPHGAVVCMVQVHVRCRCVYWCSWSGVVQLEWRGAVRRTGNMDGS